MVLRTNTGVKDRHVSVYQKRLLNRMDAEQYALRFFFFFK